MKEAINDRKKHDASQRSIRKLMQEVFSSGIKLSLTNQLCRVVRELKS